MIEVLGITIVPAENTKYYGQDDPVLAFSAIYTDGGGEITAELLAELMNPETPLKRVTNAGSPCEDAAGEYAYILVDSLDTRCPNFSVSLDDVKFVIMPLPVTVTVKGRQRRFYGEAEDSNYEYTVALSDPSIRLNPMFTNDRILSELGVNFLKREAAEVPGKYAFEIANENSNYASTLEAATYVIDPIRVDVSVSSITSRDGGFSVSTPDLRGSDVDIDPDVPRYVNITASFPSDSRGIEFSKDLNRYINSGSLLFSGSSVETSVKIDDYMYRTNRGGRTLTWPGKLPAGTKLTVSISDGNGNIVSSNEATVTVTKVDVGLSWSSTASGTPSENYLKKEDNLVLTAASEASKGEMVEVRYNGTQYFDTPDQTIKAVTSNAGNKHTEQTATATFVDALNLAFTPDTTFTFTYDDEAFPIPTENIQYENRGKKISIKLPEEGTIKSVTIPGAKVNVTDTKGTDFELDVVYSGRNLIVVYTDQVGNEGKGSTTATRTKVSTPITIKIRPELNAAGYLNGRTNVLVVSGSACSCESIQVTCADMSQTTYVSQRETWSDDNGSWEMVFDMARLPEGNDFEISAEYLDVDGSPASMTAKYNAYVAMPQITSPIFRSMPYIGGMAETGTSVLLGMQGKTYEMNMDEYGHFMMNNINIMMPGEEFTITVNDIAGNTSILSCVIPEAGDPATTSGRVTAIGRFSFGGGKDASSVSCATPVDVSSLTAGDLEIPMLLGMAYKVGTYKVSKTDKGFTVTSNLNPEVFTDPDSYTESNQSLTVYTGETGSGRGGQSYQFGEEIPVRKGTVWIVPQEDLEVLISDISWLDVYNFGYMDEEQRAADPEKYQEYLNYVAYQRGGSVTPSGNGDIEAPSLTAKTDAAEPESEASGVVEETDEPSETEAAASSPEETVPGQTVSDEKETEDENSADVNPEESRPIETESAEDVFADNELAEAAQAENAPAQTVPAETMPEESEPADQVPAEIVMEENAA